MNGWCLLVAIDGEDGEMLAWQWCDRESAAAYKALFERIAPPDVLICDGMKGIGKACAEAWPGTRIQRCLIHVQRDTRADLTSKPRLQAGRELKRLADALTRIREPEDAVRWGEALNAWHERWKTMLAERTFAKDNPDDPRAATSRGGWWWTHLPLRLFQARTPLPQWHPVLLPRPRITRTRVRRPLQQPARGRRQRQAQAHAPQPPRTSTGTHETRL